MSKLKKLTIVALASVFMLAGCGEDVGNDENGKSDTGSNCTPGVDCPGDGDDKGDNCTPGVDCPGDGDDKGDNCTPGVDCPGDIGDTGDGGEVTPDSHFNPNISYGSFIDSRNGRTYRTVTIGDQTWMAENLNYVIDSSWCYDNDEANCEIYGRLYNWYTAMANAKGSSAVPSGVQGICPAGWHLPSEAEWEILIDYAGGILDAGMKLQSITAWNIYGNTDDYGFSALPCGALSSKIFIQLGYTGFWWSTTEDDKNTDQSVRFYLLRGIKVAVLNPLDKVGGYSVRCVKN